MNAEKLLELNIKLEKLLDKKYEIIKQQADEIKTLKINYQDAMKTTCEYRNELMEERKARRKEQEK